MTITIKKVRNYVLLSTIISASATAPAQAGSLKSLNSNDDLTKTPDNQASADSKDVLVETQKCKEADSCISFPEFDLDGEFNKNDNTNSIDNSFFEKARRTDTIDSNMLKTLKSKIGRRTETIIYNTEFTPWKSRELYTSTYLPRIFSEKERFRNLLHC